MRSIHKPSGRKLGYGDLAAAASALPTPPADQIKLKDKSAFRYLGKGNVQIVDLFDITTGRAVYGIDTKLAGLKYAVIARPPVMGGKLASYDGTAAMKVPGVEKIVVIEGTPPPSKFQPIGGVAVIARNTWAAIKGRDALVIKWDDGPHASYNSAAYKAQLEETARKPGKVVRNEGDAEKALGSAAKTVFAEYYIPHLAHAPMEPTCATARVAGGKCEVWAAVQSPGGTQNELVEKLGLKPEDVTVNVTLLGGGFGRKSKPDFVLEAALLSREMGGAPVKVTWTREDDLHHDYLHTVSAERIDAGLDAQGKVIAWRHRTVAPTIRATFVPDPKFEQAGELSQGVLDVPFNIANLRCESGRSRSAYPHRLVPLGVEHPACLCDSVLCRRNCPRGGARSQGHVARASRAAAARRNRQPNTPITATRSKPTRSIPRGCGVSSSWSLTRRSGARNCRRDTARASPFIAAS